MILSLQKTINFLKCLKLLVNNLINLIVQVIKLLRNIDLALLDLALYLLVKLLWFVLARGATLNSRLGGSLGISSSISCFTGLPFPSEAYNWIFCLSFGTFSGTWFIRLIGCVLFHMTAWLGVPTPLSTVPLVASGSGLLFLPLTFRSRSRARKAFLSSCFVHFVISICLLFCILVISLLWFKWLRVYCLSCCTESWEVQLVLGQSFEYVVILKRGFHFSLSLQSISTIDDTSAYAKTADLVIVVSRSEIFLKGSLRMPVDLHRCRFLHI